MGTPTPPAPGPADPAPAPAPIRTAAGEPVDPYTGEVLPARVQVERAHPDLKLALERWHDDREYVKAFLRDHLRESEYNDKGWPITGRMHDYYRLGPQKDEYRPTADGAQKVALFFGLFKGPTDVTVLTESKEYISVRVRVVLVDGQGRARGSAEKVLSSAEATFQKSDGGLLDKYHGDARAAFNDVASRAAKRAFVEAVSITCALGDLFNDIGRERRAAAKAGTASSTATKIADPKLDQLGRPTVMPVGPYAGVPLKVLESEYLKKAREACRGRAEYGRLAEAIDDLLEHRRLSADAKA